jgi:hypothetical protein
LKLLKDFRFMFNEVDPSKFVKLINKAHIIFEPTNGFGRRTPYI